VLVPIRSLPSAKSRLASSVPAEVFERLVTAIRADTLDAVRAADPVARVVVVGDLPGPGVTLVQTSPGLNGALRDGASQLSDGEKTAVKLIGQFGSVDKMYENITLVDEG